MYDPAYEQQVLQQQQDEMALMMLLQMMGAFLIVFAIVGVVFYIFNGIALSHMAKRQGVSKPWLAWIPIANAFAMPRLVEQDVMESIRGRFTFIYGVVFAATVVFGGFFPIISIVPTILMYYAFYVLMTKYSPRPGVHLIVGILTVGIAMPFQLFAVRNNELVE